MDGEQKNDLDYDPFASIDLMKMEEEVRPDQVRIHLNLFTRKKESILVKRNR